MTGRCHFRHLRQHVWEGCTGAHSEHPRERDEAGTGARRGQGEAAVLSGGGAGDGLLGSGGGALLRGDDLIRQSGGAFGGTPRGQGKPECALDHMEGPA